MVKLVGLLKCLVVMIVVGVVTAAVVVTVSVTRAGWLAQVVGIAISVVLFIIAFQWAWRRYVGPIAFRWPTKKDVAVLMPFWIVILLALYLNEVTPAFRPFFSWLVALAALVAILVSMGRQQR